MAHAVIRQFSQRLDLEIDQGATFQPILTWQDENEVAVDLSGYSARAQIRDINDESLLHDMTTANGGIILGGPAGTIQFYISDTDTTNFTFTRAKYDLELIEPVNSYVTRLVFGYALLFPEVTV
ncbi:MAG: hypothetical protein GTN99_08125 [Candidatus Dadabacteria bacterium]|nr:hypothetical protein [Candidatus Dadabacteria bacterium]